jgi:translation initiation factor 2B subunit (eIF-2B alpha/beta/delta family)
MSESAQVLDAGHFALVTHVEHVALGMKQILATAAGRNQFGMQLIEIAALERRLYAR